MCNPYRPPLKKWEPKICITILKINTLKLFSLTTPPPLRNKIRAAQRSPCERNKCTFFQITVNQTPTVTKATVLEQ